MRLSRLISFLLLFLITVSVDRYFLFLPLTWMLLTYFSTRNRVSFLLLFLACIGSDLMLALPIGTSSIVVALSTFALRISLGSRIIQGMYLGIVGILLGVVYSFFGQTFLPVAILSTGLLYVLLYTVSTSSPTLQEI